MAHNDPDEAPRSWAIYDGVETSDSLAYRDGYQRMMREAAWAREHGWVPTERQIVLALTQAAKVYSTARGGKFVSGQRPEWLRGRADALRVLLRQQGGAPPETSPDTDSSEERE